MSKRNHRNEYQWHPSVLGVHYMDAVQRTVVRDPLLITKRKEVPTRLIVIAIVVLSMLIFGDVFF